MTHALKAHLESIKLSIATRLAYRLDFILSALTMMIAQISPALLTLVIYSNSEGFLGWSREQVLLLQGTFIFAHGVSAVFFFGILWNTIRSVEEGKLDLILLRPRSVLHSLVMGGFDLEDCGRLIGGLLIIIYSSLHLGPFPLSRWIAYSALVTLGICVLFGFAAIGSGLAIRFVKTWRIYEIFDCIFQFAEYPITMRSTPIRVITSFIIPVSMISLAPAAVLLDITIPQLPLMIAFAIIFVILAVTFWHASLKKYSSAGG